MGPSSIRPAHFDSGPVAGHIPVMRIISGRFKGRALAAPVGLETRPTADRARQGLFDMLEHARWSPGLRGARVLDLFAGTGALGIEALSRGAATAVFVERAAPALAALRRNVEACRLGPQEARVVAGDALRLPAAAPPFAPCTLLFADPPYGQGLGEAALAALALDWLAPDAVAVIEEAAVAQLTVPPGWSQLEERRFGAARFWILQRTA